MKKTLLFPIILFTTLIVIAIAAIFLLTRTKQQRQQNNNTLKTQTEPRIADIPETLSPIIKDCMFMKHMCNEDPLLENEEKTQRLRQTYNAAFTRTQTTLGDVEISLGNTTIPYQQFLYVKSHAHNINPFVILTLISLDTRNFPGNQSLTTQSTILNNDKQGIVNQTTETLGELLQLLTKYQDLERDDALPEDKIDFSGESFEIDENMNLASLALLEYLYNHSESQADFLEKATVENTNTGKSFVWRYNQLFLHDPREVVQ